MAQKAPQKKKNEKDPIETGPLYHKFYIMHTKKSIQTDARNTNYWIEEQLTQFI